MPGNKDKQLFNAIAPVYGLFYHWQKKQFRQALKDTRATLDLAAHRTILDVGCGTGALCAVLHEAGAEVIGVEPAARMLEIAKRKNAPLDFPLLQGDVLQGLPFADKTFEVSIASYVAHGMTQKDRLRMYREMCRVTTSKVIIYDFDNRRALLTSLIETLEGGDYFHFIGHAQEEMETCKNGVSACFSEVTVLSFGKRAAWYIGCPIGS